MRHNRCTVLLPCLLLLVGSLAAQPPVPPAPRLTPAEQFQLGERVRAWFALRLPRDVGGGVVRRREEQRARRAVEQAFDAAARHARMGTVLRSVADLQAILARVFDLPTQAAGGVTTLPGTDDPALLIPLWLPPGYEPNTAWPLLLTLASRAARDGDWIEAREHLARRWYGESLEQRALVAAVPLPAGLRLDQPLAAGARRETAEAERSASMLDALDLVLRSARVDTDRVVLECDRDHALGALRVVSAAPDRFAGVVLRDPPDLASIVPDNLYNVPLLLVTSPDSAAHAAAFRARLAASDSDPVTLLEGQGSFPFPGSNAAIGDWVLQVRRQKFPARVALVPLHDRHRRAAWVEIEAAEPVPQTDEAVRPRLWASVDAEHNTFVVTTRAVQRFHLLLSDALVDLDREVTVVVDGQPVWRGRRERALDELADGVWTRRDPRWLYTCRTGSVQVPVGFRAARVDDVPVRRRLAADAAEPGAGAPTPSVDPPRSAPPSALPAPVRALPRGDAEAEAEAGADPAAPRRTGLVPDEETAPLPAAVAAEAMPAIAALDLGAVALLVAPLLAVVLAALLWWFRGRARDHVPLARAR